MAIEAVERAAEGQRRADEGDLVVYHSIVHNDTVVRRLEEGHGVRFVEDLAELEGLEGTGDTVVFSAHGVSPALRREAAGRGLATIDATCPLVTKVHREAEIHYKRGRHILLIGHAGHPEVVGTLGQLPPGSITLVETLEDIANLKPADESNLAFVTQTTLSIDDTKDMVDALRARFPQVIGPHKEDICYATTNRQGAVKKVAPQVDAMIVVGSSNSSNSQRLREVAEREGCPLVRLILRSEEIDWNLFGAVKRLGITAGASAPEVLVEEVIDAFAARFEVSVDTVTTADENVFFPLPREIRGQAAE